MNTKQSKASAQKTDDKVLNRLKSQECKGYKPKGKVLTHPNDIRMRII